MTQSLYIRKTFFGVRIRRSIDSDDPERLKDDETILKLLGKNHRHVLRSIANGTLRIREAVDAYEDGKIDHLPSADELVPLDRAIEDWIAGRDFSRSTEHEYRNQMTYMIGNRKNVTLGQLPKLLALYHTQCKAEEHAPSFRIARAACQSLVKFHFGKYHRLWRGCAKVTRLKETPREKPHLDMQKINEVAEALGEYGYMWYSMAFSGMLPSEYWGMWQVRDNYIAIFGTKRVGRKRPVPLVYVPIRPKLTQSRFTKVLQKTNTGVTPKNGRDAFAQIALSAGIDRSRVDQYLGHAPRNMLDVYAFHEMKPHLDHDAALLRDVGGLPAPKLRHLLIG